MDDPGPSSLSLFIALALVAANAFLVAAEFALIAVRRTRIEQNVRLGDPRAHRVLPPIDRLEALVFSAQLARSTCTVLLGYFALVAGRRFFEPLGLLPAPAAVLSITLVILLHATLGQQVPKLIAVHRAEWITANVSIPFLELLAAVLFPITRPLSFIVRGFLRLFGVRSTGFHPLMQTPEELRMLVTHGTDPGEIESDERDMIRGVFEFAETVAREVMTPRTAMVALPVETGFDEMVKIAIEEGHSRYPVYEGTIDSIVGVVLEKDLLPLMARREELEQTGFDIRTILRPAYFVPGTKLVAELLQELRKQKVHLAIVLDEYGGTHGLVTMEDLLEEIVGEIADEYDEPEPEFERTPEGDVLIDGAVSLGEVNERFSLRLPEEEFDTLGGYVFGTLGRVPVVGDVVPAPGVDGDMELRVEETEERRVTVVRLSQPASAAAQPEEEHMTADLATGA
ncbi:MAG: HlyC/CorC family transporter [Gemmatimonadetes bacterium]|nr:HlyC/CorC family transporter [Gemmatimonadota bacterium]